MCNIKVGDVVEPKNRGYDNDLEYVVIAIYKNELWLEFKNNSFTNTGIFNKSNFIKKEVNKFPYTYNDRILCRERCPWMRRGFI